MFGLGMGEIMVILVVALLFIGPEKLPAAARQIGKTIRELRKQTDSLKETIDKDEQLGGTIRELRATLRGEDLPLHHPITPIAPPEVPPVPQIDPAAPTAPPDEPADPLHAMADADGVVRPIVAVQDTVQDKPQDKVPDKLPEPPKDKNG